jgi:hypothetical protein
MSTWPEQPVIYEINTWVWLHDLSQKYGRPVHLGNVPPQEWDAIASLSLDAVWLMGVWERSPAGSRIAREKVELQAEYRRALPDVTEEDVVGSPYCVHRYLVDDHLGGSSGLSVAREMLAGHGLRLVLDFVPNHVAGDHPWVFEHPEYCILGSQEDLKKAPNEFFQARGNVIAFGRDPYFPPWTDTAQLNAFHPELRKTMIDGMRCDMAMLMINSIFERTWGKRGGPRPNVEYWPELIHEVRKRYPAVIFVAEAYWDLEWELQQEGFDYCYDKRLYDRLVHESAESIRLHLVANPGYQRKLLRFIENHDEPRAAASFSPPKQKAAAVTSLTLQGAKLLQEGQIEGRRIRLPVQLGRRPAEPVDEDLQGFYRRLLQAIKRPSLRKGQWQLCERSGWPGRSSYLNLVAWCWRSEDDRSLIVVNLSNQRSQGRIQVPWEELGGLTWSLTDEFRGEVYKRDGNEMRHPGLFVDLEAWGFHFVKLTLPHGGRSLP